MKNTDNIPTLVIDNDIDTVAVNSPSQEDIDMYFEFIEDANNSTVAYPKNSVEATAMEKQAIAMLRRVSEWRVCKKYGIGFPGGYER